VASSENSGAPRASVLIRTLNEGRTLGAVLDAVLAQIPPPAEVLVLDSGSTDGTREAAAARAPRVRFEALEGRFTFGRALNEGTRRLGAEVVAYLSGHAAPRGDGWLAALLRPLADARVGAVYGRQVPWPDCPPWEARAIERTYGDVARLQRDDPRFSNANAAVRRAAWRSHPFDEDLPGAEDLRFAMDLQAAGMLVAYAPDAAVFHSHAETLGEVLRRAEREARAERSLGRWRWPGIVPALAGAAAHAWRDERWILARHGLRPLWMVQAPLVQFAKVRGRRRAAGDAR